MFKNKVSRKAAVCLFGITLGFFALLPIASVSASGSLLLGTITPNFNVPINTTISFQISLSGFNNPHYTLSDSLPASTLANSNIDDHGKFNWTPNFSDIGTHDVTIHASDSYGNSSSIIQTFVVSEVSPISIQSLDPGSSVFPDNALSLIVNAGGFSSPSFYVKDSFVGSTISSNDFSPSGILTWSPKESDAGVHDLTISVTGASGRLVSIYQTITVNGISAKDISDTNVSVGTPFTFTIVNYGLVNPVYTIIDSLPNKTLDDNALSGSQFSWTPQAQDVGTHTFSIVATDAGGNMANVKVTVNVVASASQNTTSLVSVPEVVSDTHMTEALCPNGKTSASNCTTAPNVAPVTTAVFASYLTSGTTNNEVLLLQKFLAQKGFFSGDATGYYGSLTEAAVKKFQTAHNIQALGAVGPATRVVLNRLYNIAPTVGNGYVFKTLLSLNSTGTEVTELQKRLTAFGVYSGPITGTFGPLTETAVKKYQAAKGIIQAGYVGPSTRTALNQ